MSWFRPHTLLDRTYLLSLAIKALDGFIEVASGLVLLFLSPDAITHLTERLTQDELTENPHNLLANFILHGGQHLAGATTFVIAYLLIHGALKLIVVAALLRQKPWAYPFALIVLGLFLAYQLYLLIVVTSVGLVVLTLFDILVIWLIWQEYQRFKHAGATAQVVDTN